jgi:hypothetical protein
LAGNIIHHDPNLRGGWRADNAGDFHARFGFGLYVYEPVGPCYVSPWYHYGALPAYVAQSAADPQSGYGCDWSQGDVYSGGDSALDQAVDEIQNTFVNQDSDALNELIPGSGEVGIFTDGSYDYSLACGGFQQMLADGSQNVETVSFTVTQVLQGNGQAVVRATHTVTDPDGGQDTVYQLYHLRSDGGQYVIADFMTSSDPI